MGILIAAVAIALIAVAAGKASAASALADDRVFDALTSETAVLGDEMRRAISAHGNAVDGFAAEYYQIDREFGRLARDPAVAAAMLLRVRDLRSRLYDFMHPAPLG